MWPVRLIAYCWPVYHSQPLEQLWLLQYWEQPRAIRNTSTILVVYMCHFWVWPYSWIIMFQSNFTGMWLHPQLWWLCCTKCFYPQINGHWYLQAFRSSSFGLYFCVYLLLCASLRLLHLKMSRVYLALYSVCIAIMFQYSYYCVCVWLNNLNFC